MKLAILATHPIQYHAPWFRALAARPGIDLSVVYALLPDPVQQGVGFDLPFRWDVPLLEGYPWIVLESAARRPALGTFEGTRVKGMTAALRRLRPDAVLLTGWGAAALFQGLVAAVRLGIPRLVRGESNGLAPRGSARRLVHRAILGRFDAYLAIGRANRAFYLDSGISEEKIFPCPYFVDNDRFEAQAASLAADRESIRASWGVAAGSVCFLFAGKLDPKKRVLDLIGAVRKLRRDDGGRAVHLLVVGAGKQMAEATRAADGLPVTFTGFLNQTEISRAYVAADCLVLPSDYGETWGLVVNEAMASGRPAIVSDRVGCGPDLVLEGETGGVFPFGDVDALAATMARIAGGDLERMGAAARSHVKGHSVETAVDGTSRALSALVPGSSPTGARRIAGATR